MVLLLPFAFGAMTMGLVAWLSFCGIAYWALLGWRNHRQKCLANARARRGSAEPVNQNEQSNGTASAAPRNFSDGHKGVNDKT